MNQRVMSLSGLRAWLVQRVTALYMVLFLVLALVLLLLHPVNSASTWRYFLALPAIHVGGILFWLALCWHAWIGMRDIVLDYIPGNPVRSFALGGILLCCCILAVWAVSLMMQAV